MAYQQGSSICLWQGSMVSLWLCLLPPSIQFSFPHLALFYPIRPSQFSLFINGNHSIQRGNLTSFVPIHESANSVFYMSLLVVAHCGYDFWSMRCDCKPQMTFFSFFSTAQTDIILSNSVIGRSSLDCKRLPSLLKEIIYCSPSTSSSQSPAS